ncbi:MAG: SHOCT domain-containing protein [Turicibacter sp.]|nr:SHOCT domain-containing protein [Turicibacter sp.]
MEKLREILGLIISIAAVFATFLIPDTDLALLPFVIAVCAVVIFIVRIYNFFIKKVDESISNPEFEGKQSKMDDRQIVLCSHDYSKFSGKVWIAENNAIRIIDRKGEKTLLFSAISAMELKLNPNAQNGVLTCKALMPNQVSGSVFAEYRNLDRIFFAREDREIAQAIHDKIGKAGSPAAPTEIAKNPDSRIAALKSLKELLDTGALTVEEFEAEKRRILGQ